MITSSQIDIAGIAEQATSPVDRRRTDVRIESAPQDLSTARTDNSRNREVVLSREAQLRYQAAEKLAFASTGRVGDSGGSERLMAGAMVAERASDVLLDGQSALRVGQAALGSSPGSGFDTGGSARLQASRYTFVSQSESRQVAASGSLELADGRKVDFSLALSQRQSRQYEFSESVRIEERPMTDPLVINFGTTSARLNDTLFEFDLNADGDDDQLPSLGGGSGYLVLDRNVKGEVDDGSELFGPASGSGFSELSRFDSDGNRWVDAADPVFEQLGVMVQKPDGSPELRTLGDVGVKALYTGSIKDQFTLVSAQGVPLGEIKATGLYLSEGGEVRTIEELNLADLKRDRVPPESEVLARMGGGTQMAPEFEAGDVPAQDARDQRIESIRQALDKLIIIRERQEAFIEQSRDGEGSERKTVLDSFLEFAYQLRLDLLKRHDRNQEVLKAYRDTGQLARSSLMG